MDRNADHWQARLPENLLNDVVWPVRTESAHDDAVPVAKWRGYDALGELCWVRYRYSHWSAAFDDADAPPTLLREDEFEAWRSLLGTWVRRTQSLDHRSGQTGDSGFEIVVARAIPRL